jgi:N-acetylmuramoyl-L-alanine amidase
LITAITHHRHSSERRNDEKERETMRPTAMRAFPILRLLRAASVLLALALLAACAPLPPRNPLATWVPSPNHDIRRPVLIVLHFTDQQSVRQSLETLRTANSGGPVSAHYLIGADGHLYQLVSDQLRAWHAGGGRWGTITDLNSASIGIELDNDGHSPFAQAQIDSLLRLLADLTERLQIPREQIIGHQDLTPARKNDPGPLFPWQRLAAAGFGRWPQGVLADPPAGFDPWMALAVVGYPLDDRAAAVRAFHNHFRGLGGDELDPQDSRILWNLVQQIESGG